MKTTSKILLSTLLAGAAAFAPLQAAVIYSDIMDATGDGYTSPWTLGGTESSFTTSSGLTATAGDEYWYMSTTSDRAVQIYDTQFNSLTIAEGTYTATFDVGRNSSFARVTRQGLTADLTGNSESFYLQDETGVTFSSSTTEPALDSWATWTLTYEVSSGSEAIGKDLGFFLITATNNQSIAIDNFSVDFVGVAIPEPSSFALLAGCFGFLWVMVRRRG